MSEIPPNSGDSEPPKAAIVVAEVGDNVDSETEKSDNEDAEKVEEFGQIVIQLYIRVSVVLS
jgi:hypothetical protein